MLLLPNTCTFKYICTLLNISLTINFDAQPVMHANFLSKCRQKDWKLPKGKENGSDSRPGKKPKGKENGSNSKPGKKPRGKENGSNSKPGKKPRGKENGSDWKPGKLPL